MWSFKKRIVLTEIVVGLLLFGVAVLSSIDIPDGNKIIPNSTIGIVTMIFVLIALTYMIFIMALQLKKKFVLTEEQRQLIETSAYPAAAIVFFLLIFFDILLDLLGIVIQLKPGMIFYPISIGVLIHGFFVLRSNKKILLVNNEVEEL